MKCMDCKKFSPWNSNLEASKEIAPVSQRLKGVCGVSNKSCGSFDKCNCDGFEEKLYL